MTLQISVNRFDTTASENEIAVLKFGTLKCNSSLDEKESQAQIIFIPLGQFLIVNISQFVSHQPHAAIAH